MITNATSPSHTMLTVRVHAVRAEACDVLSLDLRPVAGTASGAAPGAAQHAAGKVITVFDGMPGVARLDIAAVVREAPAGAHFYCCGPVPMLTAFEAATAACDDGHVHVEWFSAPAAAPATAQDHAAADGSFTVQLKRKGKSFTIPAGKTILEVLLDGGIDVDYSCREGLCGTCETRVLAGVPDHRDPILAGKKDPPQSKIMVCVSRCAGPELVLDL
ncbi:hypothetical protein BH11PSE7_BH11PSE7_21180 [soil metagenome]